MNKEIEEIRKRWKDFDGLHATSKWEEKRSKSATPILDLNTQLSYVGEDIHTLLSYIAEFEASKRRLIEGIEKHRNDKFDALDGFMTWAKRDEILYAIAAEEGKG